MIKTKVMKLAVVVGAVVVSALCAPALAHAHHPEVTPLPVTYSLGENFSVPCSGQLTGAVHTPHDRPGHVTVRVSWLPFFTAECHNALFVYSSSTASVNGEGFGVRLLTLPSASRALQPMTGEITFPMAPGEGSIRVTPNAVSTTYLDPLGNTAWFHVA